MRLSPSTFILIGFCVTVSARADWKNESGAGVVVANGNSRSQSLSFQQGNSYEWPEKQNALIFKGNFLQTKSLGVLSAKRWDSVLRYERSLSDRLSLFLAQGVESDRFAGFKQRYNSDIGPKYFFVKNKDGFDWLGEVGYRFSRENRLNGTRTSQNQARVYTELNKKWNEGASSRLWAEYLPNFSRRTDWLFNSEISTSAAFNRVFSVKLAYLVKYDHLPAPTATTQTDSLFTTSLVASY